MDVLTVLSCTHGFLCEYMPKLNVLNVLQMSTPTWTFQVVDFLARKIPNNNKCPNVLNNKREIIIAGCFSCGNAVSIKPPNRLCVRIIAQKHMDIWTFERNYLTP